MLQKGALSDRVRALFVRMKTLRAGALILLLSAVPATPQIGLNPLPARVIGQNSLTVSGLTPNLVEGREFADPEGIALDTSMNPPALYVADTSNNRVLGFRSAVAFTNGQKADVVLGQPDLVTTIAQGPNRTTRSSGTAAPTAVAVDKSGNVYVLDNGNNRILRFPQPFQQTGDQIPDFVIGQPGFTTNSPNQGGISASTIAYVGTVASGGSTSNTLLQAYLTFDSAGNLWTTDPGNNRVLRFNATVLANGTPGPAADVVLGQQDFFTGTYNPNGNPLTAPGSILTPTGIAFDSAGRLFVSESSSTRRGRILMYVPPFSAGQFASRFLGVDQDVPQPPTVSEFQLSISPGNLFAAGNQIGIADTFNNRLLLFPPVEQWIAGKTYQAATQVIGQKDFATGSVNQGQPMAGPTTLLGPAAAVFSGTELYIADTYNSRVIVMPRLADGTFGPATRVLGQDTFDANTVNLIEGREFNFGNSDAGIAVDLNANPPRLYVADTYNNRILGFSDLRNLQPGAKADIVIGQADFRHSLVNYPTNDSTKLNATGLSHPTGLAVDAKGNLWVADTGNSRVLRFPAPFANYQAGVAEAADLVIGQLGFATKITDASSRTMASPYGLALTVTGGLVVSDVTLNRVLYFAGDPSTFRNGMSASVVFGQKDFNSAGAGSALDQLNGPYHIAIDSDDRLYVADSGNGRIMIFDNAPAAGTDPFAAATLTAGLQVPRGMYVSASTGDIWVADVAANVAVRYPQYLELAANNYASNLTLQAAGGLAIVSDTWGNMFLADSTNRVVTYYPGLTALNAANYVGYPLAPGEIASLFSAGNMGQFGAGMATAPKVPLPTTLNGIQLTLNGVLCPLFFAGPDQINFQVPWESPTSGFARAQVLDVATGRILGDSFFAMNTVSPGIFTQEANGSGSAVAQNQDGTLNTPTNPAVQGTVLTVYGTGQGYIQGAPADGDVSNAPLNTADKPNILLNIVEIPPADILYYGLSPGLVGVWQLNFKIPITVVSTPTAPIHLLVYQGSLPIASATFGRTVSIYVKQRP